MKIAVVGTGAMGSIYAARLAEAGHDVVAVDIWAEHIAAIRKSGLTVDGPQGSLTCQTLRATTEITEAAGAELVILATKAAGVGSAAQALAPVLAPEAVVLTIQNGLGTGERLSEYLPTDRILLGVAEGFGAAMSGPGKTRHTAMRRIRLGELVGGISDRLERVAKVWRSGGFDVTSYDDIHQLIWEKFLCNVTLGGPCTAFGCTVTNLISDPERWAVALGCMDEAWRVGRALNIRFSFDDPVAYVTEFATAVGKAKPSMLQDHEAGRNSELDAINGQVPVLGRRLGIATPYNETISAVIRAREAAI